MLAALGGDRAECVAMLEAWGAHAADLDVLALGPRSPGDELAVTWELVDELRALSGPAARSVPMRPGPAPGPSSRGAGHRPGPGGIATPGPRDPGDRPAGWLAADGAADPGPAGPPAVPRAGAGPGPARRTAVPVRPGPRLPAAPLRPGRIRLVRRPPRGNAEPAGQRTAGPDRRPGRRWPRPPGRGSASTPTRSGPRCTRVPAGAASRGTGPGYGPRSRSAGWPGSGRRVSPWWTATWSWTCWRPAGHGCRCSGSQPRGRNPPS